MISKPDARRAGAALFAALTLGSACTPCAAQSDAPPWQLAGSIALGYDDNLFRDRPGAEVADGYATGSVSGAMNLRLGRQKVLGSVTLRNTRFADRTDLDHTGYSLASSWEGETVESVSWRLAFQADRTLASYATVVDPTQRTANIETSRQFDARLQLGGVAQWVATLELGHRSIDNSAAAYDNDDFELDSVSAAAVWHPLGPLTLSVRPRFTHGRYPHARDASGPAPIAFDRRDVDLVAQWLPTGDSTLNARLSWTSQQFTAGGERDLDGATGQLSWSWRMTGKTRTDLSLSRDTGSETSFFSLGGATQPLRGQADNSRLTTRLAAALAHDLTGKVSLTAATQWSRQTQSSRSLLAATGSTLATGAGDVTVASLTLGARYAPTLRRSLGCELTWQHRSAGDALSTPFSARTVQCTGQIAMH